MSQIYYHFTSNTLRNGEPIPPIGEWLVHEGSVVPCESGLHASPDAFDALHYAPAEMLHRVELDGVIVPHGDPVDKYAAEKRRIVASIDATPILRLFARRVALDVIDLWDTPPIVKEFLETGEESKRAAARDTAWAAARAARDTAWAARDAKQKLYRGWFNEMVDAAFAEQSSTEGAKL